MSDRTSKTILEADKILQKRREEAGKAITPYNYDTTINIEEAINRSQEASHDIILDNNKTLVQHAIEANAPKTVEKTENDVEKILANDFEAATIDTSAIPSQEKNNSKELGDEDEKEGNER